MTSYAIESRLSAIDKDKAVVLGSYSGCRAKSQVPLSIGVARG